MRVVLTSGNCFAICADFGDPRRIKLNRKNTLKQEQVVQLSAWLLSNKKELESSAVSASELLPRIEKQFSFHPTSNAVYRIANAAEVFLSAEKPLSPRAHKITVVARSVVELYRRLGEEPEDELLQIANPTLNGMKEGS